MAPLRYAKMDTGWLRLPSFLIARMEYASSYPMKRNEVSKFPMIAHRRQFELLLLSPQQNYTKCFYGASSTNNPGIEIKATRWFASGKVSPQQAFVLLIDKVLTHSRSFATPIGLKDSRWCMSLYAEEIDTLGEIGFPVRNVLIALFRIQILLLTQSEARPEC